ncbi:hypothetical protein ACP4OV_018386 [Aristida adscensionis]
MKSTGHSLTHQNSDKNYKNISTTTMAKFNKNTSHGPLLLCLILLSFSAIPALYGRSIDSTESQVNPAQGHDFNGCYENHNKTSDPSAVFCCRKDNLCWASLPECIPNCPCKANCVRPLNHRG